MERENRDNVSGFIHLPAMRRKLRGTLKAGDTHVPVSPCDPVQARLNDRRLTWRRISDRFCW
jgi:hypothetical protein